MAKRRTRSAPAPAKPAARPAQAESYQHPESKLPLRPDVGTQPQFKKKKPPQRYRYDSSLAPALEWDGENPARELADWLLRQIEELAAPDSPLPAGEGQGVRAVREFKGADGQVLATVTGLQDAVEQLKRLSRPFLNWSGKAERLSFDVPTLPLFVHERLSTKAIIETLTGHKRDRAQMLMDFGDPAHTITDQVLRAYEYQDQWVNRMVLGDSLVVMNSLLRYESLGGQVQMIYMDPPYGVKFGSNFQPFVRKRDVKHGDDDDLTREPEMVQAYRDTWELGLHSYLSYMRDRLLLCRELLMPSGSVFVQISDENLHHVREVMDEVFGAENFVCLIPFAKTSGQTPNLLSEVHDYLLWYAREKDRVKYRQLYLERGAIENPTERYICVETSKGGIIDLSFAQKAGLEPIPDGRLLKLSDLTSQTGGASSRFPIEFGGRTFHPSANRGWSTSAEGVERLRAANLLHAQGNTLWWKNYRDRFPFRPLRNDWDDVKTNAFGDPRFYVVQTGTRVIQRCMLMTTDPGDLVFDPTCGSGTTAYVAEQWGRRWITADVSRVPLALARQRLLTATFPWHQLKDEDRGPAGGFVYRRKQNKKGEEVGGIVPHVTLKSIANNEPPAEEVLVDRPESASGITRVTGPYTFEASIPTAVDVDDVSGNVSGTLRVPPGPGTRSVPDTFADRMLEILRKSPLLQLGGNKTVKLTNIRPPAKTLSLSAEALVDSNGNGNKRLPSPPAPLPSTGEGSPRPVALVFGPETAAVSETLVYNAAREATAKSYAHLYVIGFAIQANARALIEECEAAIGIPATYVQATPDLLMGDLLKNMRSSQIFSVCGLPEVAVRKVSGTLRVPTEKTGTRSVPDTFEVELLGLDVFDPVKMESDHRRGDDVPAWFLDTDYNELCFHVSQAFFPRTAAWDNLKRALKGEYDEAVWDHLAGTVSAPFEAGEHGQIAVKVIDDRGNELVVVKKLS